MQKAQCFLYNKQIKDLAKKGQSVLKDLPHLPQDWVKNIVKVLPYLLFIAAIFSAITGLQNLFAFNNRQAWFMNLMQINRTYYYISAAFSFLFAILYFMAYKAVKNKSYEGWLLLLWAVVLSALQTILFLIFGWGNIFSSLIGIVLSVYLLYEILPEFTNKASEKTVKTQEKK